MNANDIVKRGEAKISVSAQRDEVSHDTLYAWCGTLHVTTTVMCRDKPFAFRWRMAEPANMTADLIHGRFRPPHIRRATPLLTHAQSIARFERGWEQAWEACYRVARVYADDFYQRFIHDTTIGMRAGALGLITARHRAEWDNSRDYAPNREEVAMLRSEIVDELERRFPSFVLPLDRAEEKQSDIYASIVSIVDVLLHDDD
jgi:hypothetical protein